MMNQNLPGTNHETKYFMTPRNVTANNMYSSMPDARPGSERSYPGNPTRGHRYLSSVDTVVEPLIDIVSGAHAQVLVMKGERNARTQFVSTSPQSLIVFVFVGGRID
jgi:hypothetical protein